MAGPVVTDIFLRVILGGSNSLLGGILLTFVCRLAAGLAAALAMTPPKWVVSSFYRVHMWVLLGLFTFAAVVTAGEHEREGLLAAILGAVVSYAGSVAWLYEKTRAGMVCLLVATGIGLWAALEHAGATSLRQVLDTLTASLLLGFTMCAMLLGHWYLNTPTMKLEPLKNLVLAMLAAVALRAVVAGIMSIEDGFLVESTFAVAITGLRWLAGLVGLGVVGLMTWQTLRVPNTQSATGILYVGVILAFLGELAAQVPTGQ